MWLWKISLDDAGDLKIITKTFKREKGDKLVRARETAESKEEDGNREEGRLKMLC